MNIGFFGGSFNPPTNAHVNLAKKVLEECKLDKVIFVPIGDFHTKNELLPSKERYNMLKLVCENLKDIEVSDIEVGIEKKLYAIDAFRLIEENFKDTNIFFIMGADNFINITKWKEFETLISKYKYIILDRENIDIEDFIKSKLKKYENNFKVIQNEHHKACSSSKFRKMLKEKDERAKDIIPKEVYDYIIENDIF